MELTTNQLKQIIKEELAEMFRQDPRDFGKWTVDREYVDNLARRLGVSGGVIESPPTEEAVSYTILLGTQNRFGNVDEFEFSLYKDRKRPRNKKNYGWFSVQRSILMKSLKIPLYGNPNEDAVLIDALRQLSWDEVVSLANSQKRGDYSWINQIVPGHYRG
tara:strand:- start:386 stop:868 length:483 start_codon:yes stop_codon:yes gene_type:complete